MTDEPEKRYFALTEAEIDEINSGLSYVEQHYMIPTDQPQVISGLDWDADAANRWAAFTTTELQHLIDSFQGDIWGTDVTTMDTEIRAELDRRKDADGS